MIDSCQIIPVRPRHDVKASSEVLARKYRPENFDELIGQDTIAQTLSLALDSNRLSHAYLLSGLRGSGKTSTARIFAKALVCDKGPTSRPCGVCEQCIMAKEGRHIDIIEMDAASSRKIDDIRDLIEHTKYKPASAAYKIFIIDEVHMLTKEAFNALLKTLEEPPAYVKFILATTDPLKLPATILSRTQHFRFKRISNINIVNHLQHILRLEDIEYQNEALEILARSGSGSLRDTLTLLDQAIIYSKSFVDVKTVTEMLGLIDPEFIAAIFQAVFDKKHSALVAFTKKLEDYEAEMVVDELIAYLKERLYAQDPLFSTLILERFFRILSDAKSLFAINADGAFVISLIFFKMVEALRVKEIDQMIESLEREVQRPASVTMPEPSGSTIEQLPDTKAEISVTPVPVQPSVVPGEALFEGLRAKIVDRNAQLGRCFTEQVHFISYTDNTLTWESCADEECKKQLRHGFSVIKQFVRELFGFETEIKHQSCTKAQSTPSPQSQPQQRREEPVRQETHYQPPVQEAPQSASMTEEIETDSGSCVTGCDSDDQVSSEFDGHDILNEPMVQKAKELFEATKITIQSKV